MAVEQVDLDVAPGEFVTLLGPSGSGKTTTLMMIAGFTSPTAGSQRSGAMVPLSTTGMEAGATAREAHRLASAHDERAYAAGALRMLGEAIAAAWSR